MKDLIILGNGMAGMTAALYAKRANLDFKIVGKDEFDFGQIGNAILVENYPCAAPQTGFDLAMKLHDQLSEIGVDIEEHEVKNIFKDCGNNCFVIEYDDGTIANAKTVIYALGAAPRKLNCKIEEGIPIHYCALCDGALYKDKTVAVIGGGDSAFTQAEYLSKICKQVIIIMCDENITANSLLVNRIKSIKNISIIYNTPIERIVKNDKGYFLSPFTNENGKLYSLYGISVDGIFVAIGMEPNTKPLRSLIPLYDGGYINCWEDSLQSMHSPGLFAAGDVRVKKVRQSITAAADGAIAVQSVIDYLKRRE
jgi:thioredoxin reductase (NADPH)